MNPRPLVPETSTLTGLSFVPFMWGEMVSLRLILTYINDDGNIGYKCFLYSFFRGFKMASKNAKTTMYKWKERDKVLGYGITDNLEKRKAEHKREEPRSEVEVVDCKPEPEARDWGRKRIENYEKEHGEPPPKNRPR